ncbi:MAG: hypothetical protein IEMM0003_0583 [bacterium]|nr:MAG: hypothetical protein IEMM0003_0583 [bacterium]
MPKVATKLRISKKGQISIPKRVREKLGIVPGDMVAFEQVDEGFILKKKKTVFDYIGCIRPKKEIDIKELIEKARKESGAKRSLL